ncbi:MAG: DUF1830 domain-containing protein [Leptolyngbyaceae cyanobacterium]
MKPASASTLPEKLEQILCHYVNETSQLQIVRVTNTSTSCLERVISPGQRLTFQASPEAFLEIYTYEFCSSVLADRIACSRLIAQSCYYVTRSLHQKHHLQTMSSAQAM